MKPRNSFLIALTLLTSASSAAFAQTPSTSPLENTPATMSTHGDSKNEERSVTNTDIAMQPLTLEEAIQIAFANHGNVGSARQSVEAARQRIKSAQAARAPQASLTASGDLSKNGAAASSTSYSVSTQTNLGLSQIIYDGGRTSAQVNQAKANATSASASASIGVAQQNLAYSVATYFYEQLRQERLLKQREQQVVLAQEQLAQVQAQIEAGTSARVDAQSVNVTLSQAKFDLVTARNARSVAQTNLRNAMGLNTGPGLMLREDTDVAALSNSFSAPTTEQAAAQLAAPHNSETITSVETTETTAIEATPTSTPVTFRLPQLVSLESYQAEAQTRRPDLNQQRATVQRAEAAVSIAKAENKPQVGATAGYNLQNSSGSSRGLTAGVSLSLPIFDAGGRKADVKAAQAELSAAKTTLAQSEKDVAADVEAAYVKVSGAVENINNAQALVESARSNLEAATEKYRAGIGIVLDVVNAQTQFAAAQTSATSAIYDYQLALADLQRAAGRFSS